MELDSTVDCKMNWYCRVHVLVPYNIKLYTVLRSPLFDYGVRLWSRVQYTTCTRWRLHVQSVLLRILYVILMWLHNYLECLPCY